MDEDSREYAEYHGRFDYQVVRNYFEAGIRRRVIQTHMSLAQVQAHCKDPDTSSSTCTSKVGRARTRKVGAWFDGYERM